MLPAQAARTRAMREERVRQVLVTPGYVGVLVWEWAVQPGAGATELWAEGEGGMRGRTSREPWKGDGQQGAHGSRRRARAWPGRLDRTGWELGWERGSLVRSEGARWEERGV